MSRHSCECRKRFSSFAGDHCPPGAVRAGPFQPRSSRVGKGLRERRSSGHFDLSGREALGCICRNRRDGVANARHPIPGTQSISALEPEVPALPEMDYVPSRPEPTGLANVIATAVEVVARAVVPAPRHSCGSRNRFCSLSLTAITARQAPSAQALSNPRAHGLERAYANDARRATSAEWS